MRSRTCTVSYSTMIHDISELGMSALIGSLGLKDREAVLRLVLDFLLYESAAPQTVYHRRLRTEFFKLGLPITDSVRLGNWVIKNLTRLEEMFGDILHRDDSTVDEILIHNGVARVTLMTLED